MVCQYNKAVKMKSKERTLKAGIEGKKKKVCDLQGNLRKAISEFLSRYATGQDRVG